MIDKIIGHIGISEMMKKLRGGPQSMNPLPPLKGSGVPSAKGVTPTKPRDYVVAAQKPKRTPWWA